MSPLVALVTGANSGFGLATSQALAERGYRVYATYRNPRKAGHLWQLSKNLSLYPMLMDVDRKTSVDRAVGQILKREGRIDVLLNNAGFVMAGCWEDLSDSDILAQFQTNVFGLLRVTRAVMPAMRKQGSGKIINVGSVAGFTGTPFIGAYSATKFAVNSITEALRMEGRPWGIDVTEMNPGEVRTNVVQNARMGQKVKSPSSSYTPFAFQMESWQKGRFTKAAPVEMFVTTILKALGDKSMKRRYLVKFDDYLLYYFRWLLPDALWEWGLSRMFPWSRWP
jgi:NAD(P)-dependent dehydrogenase (short-subunit alcohol dehydrogenase family)